MNWNAIFTFCGIFGNFDFYAPNQHDMLCFIQLIIHRCPSLDIGGLGMERNAEVENSKDGNDVKTPVSTSETSHAECKPIFEIPALIIELKDSRNTGSNDAETLVSTSSANNDDPLLQDHPYMSTALRNGFPSLKATSGNKNGSTALSSSEENTSENILLAPSDVRLVRSTSLKSTDTPAETQSHKKFVRFADALGLDLEDIRHFIKGRTPTVPQSAFADLDVSSSSGAHSSLPVFNIDTDTSNAKCTFTPEFQQPGSNPQFMNRLQQQKVCLENILINGYHITGVVRTLNMGFEKQVQIRYTTDDWLSHNDITANYITDSSDGFSDKFAFTISLPNAVHDERLIFVVKYVINEAEYWDNNIGQNFTLKCVSKQT